MEQCITSLDGGPVAPVSAVQRLGWRVVSAAHRGGLLTLAKNACAAICTTPFFGWDPWKEDLFLGPSNMSRLERPRVGALFLHSSKRLRLSCTLLAPYQMGVPELE